MKRLAVGLVLATLAPASALAVESGTGAYLLGTRGLAAGYVPGPGVYISDSIIYLQSRTKSDISIGGAIVADPSIEALVNRERGQPCGGVPRRYSEEAELCR